MVLRFSRLSISRVSFTAPPSRLFSQTSTVQKKKGKPASKAAVQPESVEQEVKQLDLPSLKAQLEATTGIFADKLKEIKGGSLDQKKFFSLPVATQGSVETPLGQLATIATRGNKITIVSYDPKNVKHIRTAIVGKLGVPAEESTTDSQTISVTLGGNTANQKAEQLKQFKAEFEHLKSSASRHSISSIRTKFMNVVKKTKEGKSQQDQKKEAKQVEDLVKQYQEKLQEMLRKASG